MEIDIKKYLISLITLLTICFEKRGGPMSRVSLLHQRGHQRTYTVDICWTKWTSQHLPCRYVLSKCGHHSTYLVHIMCWVTRQSVQNFVDWSNRMLGFRFVNIRKSAK